MYNTFMDSAVNHFAPQDMYGNFMQPSIFDMMGLAGFYCDHWNALLKTGIEVTVVGFFTIFLIIGVPIMAAGLVMILVAIIGLNEYNC